MNVVSWAVAVVTTYNVHDHCISKFAHKIPDGFMVYVISECHNYWSPDLFFFFFCSERLAEFVESEAEESEDEAAGFGGRGEGEEEEEEEEEEGGNEYEEDEGGSDVPLDEEELWNQVNRAHM